MLSQSHRHRAGARRLFAAALAAVAVVATSVLILSAPPASAAPPADFDQKVAKALTDARAALQRPECELLLRGPGNQFPPRNVLNTARTRFLDVPPPPLPADTGASVQGRGLSQTITFYPTFFRYGSTLQPDGSQVIVQPRFDGRPEVSDERLKTDGDLLRALAVLHEVGHLTLREPSHEGRIDEAGRPIQAGLEEGLYNTRILNTCFADQYLIAGATCEQNLFTFDSTYGNSPIGCTVTCRPDAGPVVVAWTSSLQSTVTADNSSGSCRSTRVSGCPPPSGYVYAPTIVRAVFPPTDITITVTNGTGHVSQDTFRVTCTDPNLW